MSTLELADHKDIPQRDKDLVGGYIRDIQVLLPKDAAYYNIPISINYICALFYYLHDTWDPDRVHSVYKIKDDTLTRMDPGAERSAFLTTTIHSGISHWKFQLTKYNGNSYVDIGVVKKEQIDFEQAIDTFLGKFKDIYYIFSAGSHPEINIHGKNNEWKRGYGAKTGEGDVIDMYLDLEELELSFSINGTHYGKAFDVDTGYGYVAALSMLGAGNEVKLLAHDCKHYKNH